MLKSSILPNLRIILPDDFSVAEQAQIFANAKFLPRALGWARCPFLFNTPSANRRRIILHSAFRVLVIDNAAIKPLSLSSNIATNSK